MAEKEIALLQEQIARLGDQKFDLEAWKNSTLIYLERIFGKESSKLKMIRDLAYDYSSWNLRDTAATGKTGAKDPVLLQAEEILTATITELKTLGLPELKQGKNELWELLSEDLTGKKLRELEILTATSEPERVEKMKAILEELGKERLSAILVKILTT
jgi:hypothetical protein